MARALVEQAALTPKRAHRTWPTKDAFVIVFCASLNCMSTTSSMKKSLYTDQSRFRSSNPICSTEYTRLCFHILTCAGEVKTFISLAYFCKQITVKEFCGMIDYGAERVPSQVTSFAMGERLSVW